ncbi:MFS transporter [Saccharothrix sp. ST-888]|uniref:MFS transporter n=1 Tax=Saccharothrix sp. ST-888 TaxID=1427391 RepID=UPI0007C789EA|nr:MFS transporter [Saccharothrix sp. ST-888]
MTAGTVVALAGSALGFRNAFSMDPAMADMAVPIKKTSALHPLHGMPLSRMPEMFLAVAGLLVVVLGVSLRRRAASAERPRPAWTGHRVLIAVIGTAALTIDISKTSTLGFVIPGMRAEYGLDPKTASLLAVAGLAGTATGAVLFAALSERFGRRGSYLLATIGFTVTSVCGSMPSFAGNLVMCGLMGMAVGGLAPLLITLLTETFGGRVRGSVVVALSVVATAVGYLVAAGSATWLEPVYGWRVLWLIGAPTGLVLVLLTPLVPDFSAQPRRSESADRPPVAAARAFGFGAQRTFAVLIGVLTFGLTTWVPSLARLGGVPVGTANKMLTVAAVAMVPCALLLMRGYRRYGPIVLAAALATATALLLLALTASGAVTAVRWVCAGALVAALFAVNTMAAVFLPIAADLAAPGVRGRATATVSLFNRLGGLCGPLLLAGLVSSASRVLVAVAVLALLCAGAAWLIGRRQQALGGAWYAGLEPLDQQSGRRAEAVRD